MKKIVCKNEDQRYDYRFQQLKRWLTKRQGTLVIPVHCGKDKKKLIWKQGKLIKQQGICLTKTIGTFCLEFF